MGMIPGAKIRRNDSDKVQKYGFIPTFAKMPLLRPYKKPQIKKSGI